MMKGEKNTLKNEEKGKEEKQDGDDGEIKH